MKSRKVPAPSPDQHSIFSLVDPPASPSLSPDDVRAWRGKANSGTNITAFLTSIDRLGLSGKTSPEFYQAAPPTTPATNSPDTTSPSSSPVLPDRISQFLKRVGATAESPTAPSTPWRGGYLTLVTGESHSAADACSLSDVLQPPEEVPPKYYLSAKALAGIYNRAVRRGKTLPPLLAALLGEAVQEAGTGPTRTLVPRTAYHLTMSPQRWRHLGQAQRAPASATPDTNS